MPEYAVRLQSIPRMWVFPLFLFGKGVRAFASLQQGFCKPSAANEDQPKVNCQG